MERIFLAYISADGSTTMLYLLIQNPSNLIISCNHIKLVEYRTFGFRKKNIFVWRGKCYAEIRFIRFKCLAMNEFRRALK